MVNISNPINNPILILPYNGVDALFIQSLYQLI